MTNKLYTQQDEDNAFCNWAIEKNYVVLRVCDINPSKPDDYRYICPQTAHAWEAWQTSAKFERCPPPVRKEATVKKKNKKLEVGMFVKTRGAKDGVGLRKIVECSGGELLVDHYAWRVEKDASGNKEYSVVRKPYSSEVMANKVCKIYNIEAGTGKLLESEKF